MFKIVELYRVCCVGLARTISILQGYQHRFSLRTVFQVLKEGGLCKYKIEWYQSWALQQSSFTWEVVVFIKSVLVLLKMLNS